MKILVSVLSSSFETCEIEMAITKTSFPRRVNFVVS